MFSNFLNSNNMKKSLILILASIAIIMSSCGKKNAEKLLKTIPQNAQFVAMINAENLTEDLGEQGAGQLDQLVNSTIKGNSTEDKMIKYIFGKDSQLDINVPVFVFGFKNSVIATFALKDDDQFRKDIESQAGANFSKEKSVWYLPDHTVFVSDDQAWITGKYPEIQPSEITSFTKLPDASSMNSVAYMGQLIEQDADVSALVDVQALIQANMNMQANLFLNMAFADPRYLSYCMNFEKGKIQGELSVLNSKYEPAAIALRPSKINVAALNSFPGKGNLFVAGAFDSSTVSKIIGQVKSFAPVPPEVLTALENIDGNVVMSSFIKDPSAAPEQLTAMITFKDNMSANQCLSFFEDMIGSGEGVQCRAEGNTLIVSTPGQEGQPISSVAKDFEGAGMAMVFDISSLNPVNNGNVSNLFSTLVVKLTDNGASSKISYAVTTKQSQNALITLLQAINSSNQN